MAQSSVGSSAPIFTLKYLLVSIPNTYAASANIILYLTVYEVPHIEGV